MDDRAFGGKAKGAAWAGALRRALHEYSSNRVKAGTALKEIAVKVVEMALEGDRFSIQEIGDRMDGKAVARTETSVTVYDGLSETDIRTLVEAIEIVERSATPVEGPAPDGTRAH